MRKSVNLFLLLTFVSHFSYAQDKPILIASGHPEYPPFMWAENDKIVGAGPAIASKIFAELGIEVDVRAEGSWKRVLHRAKLGRIDFVVGAFKTPEREAYMSFIETPYIQDPVVIYVKKGSVFSFEQWGDLRGKVGATGSGESYGEAFDSYEKANLNITRVNDMNLALTMLVRDRVDYVICGFYSCWVNILKLDLEKKVEKLPHPVNSPVAYQAFSKRSPYAKHFGYYNKRFKELEESGEIARIIEKYMRYWQQQKQSAGVKK